MHRIHRRVTRSLGSGPCLLAGGARRLSSIPQPLSLLPACFARLALPIAAFTRFFSQSPVLLRLMSGSLCRQAAFFSQPTVLLSSLTAVVSLRGHLLCLLALLFRRNVLVTHEIHLPAAYQLRPNLGCP